MTHAGAGTDTVNPLFELQRTLYRSGNFTRRRLHQTRLRWVKEAIGRHARAPSTGGRAIEYGPGCGIYLPTLTAQFPEVVAADVESAYLLGIESLRHEVTGLVLAVDDIQDSRFGEGAFDLALCSEVLEHVPDPEISLKTLYRILKAGGTAIVSTPQRYSLMELCCKVAFLPGIIQVVRHIYKEPVLPTGHISLRTSRAFGAAIRDAGFEIVEEAHFGLYVPALAEFGGEWGGRVIQALERRLAGTSLRALFWTQAYVLRKPSP